MGTLSGGGEGLCPGLGEVSSGESQVVPSCRHSPLSPNTALSPEEAESALEAAHYFTEDSSSEGEHSPPLAPGPAPSRAAEGRAGGLQPSPGVGGVLHGGAAEQRPAPQEYSHSCFSCLCLPGSWLLLPSASAPPRCPFQRLLWPPIWIFSCPGRFKVSAGGQGCPLCTWLPQGLGLRPLNTPLHGQEAWKLLVPEMAPVWLSSE